jgi:aryl-alcohol dehydrogenase-like predicted oxidoreductase
MQLDDPPEAVERAEATVRAALDAGIPFVDTAIAHGPAHLGRATMVGPTRTAGGASRPASIEDSAMAADLTLSLEQLARLG